MCTWSAPCCEGRAPHEARAVRVRPHGPRHRGTRRRSGTSDRRRVHLPQYGRRRSTAPRSRRGPRLLRARRRAGARRRVRGSGGAPRGGHDRVAGAGGGRAARGRRAGGCARLRRELLDRSESVLPDRRTVGGAVPRARRVRPVHRGGAPRHEARRALGHRARPEGYPAAGAGTVRRAADQHASGPHSGHAPRRVRCAGRSNPADAHRPQPRNIRRRGPARGPLAGGGRTARHVCLRGRIGRHAGDGKEGRMTLRVEWLRGCGTALVTPFTATGEVDEARFRALLERQIAGGVRLLVPCGTTGEGATLDPREHERLIALTVDVARRRARVIAGVGSNATAVTIERARAARGAGADAILVVAPYSNKPTQAGLVAHFRAVADAVEDLPVVLYNVPGRTASNITAATTLTLAGERANIVGTKEASADLAQIMAILRDRPPNFCVLSGDDAITLPLIALGADGVVSVVSNEVPDAMARLTDLALRGEWGAARTQHYRLLPLMEANFIESNPGPVKAALAALGLLEEHYRLPLVPVQEQTRARMRGALAELGLLQGAAHVAA